MQATFVKLDEAHRRILQERARGEGCSMSDLIRRATILHFHLPTGGPNLAVEEQKEAYADSVEPEVETNVRSVEEALNPQG